MVDILNRGVAWLYDIGSLPGAQRQIANGAPGPTVCLTTAVPVEVGRCYAWKLTGPAVFETAGNAGSVAVFHEGAEFEKIWFGTAARAADVHALSAWSRTFAAAAATLNMSLRMNRGVGTGAFTLDIGFGPLTLELCDVSRGN